MGADKRDRESEGGSKQHAYVDKSADSYDGNARDGNDIVHMG